ncbi:MAG: hypothetical protein Q9181_003324 [Wetmoreana brouardii]
MTTASPKKKLPIEAVPSFRSHLSPRSGVLAHLPSTRVPCLVPMRLINSRMDVEVDEKAGVKFVAVKHEQRTQETLTVLAVSRIGLLLVVGCVMKAYAVEALVVQAWMVRLVQS